MRKVCLLALLALPAAGDTLDETLAQAGFTRAQLGWTPRGWWSRFPRTIPHKLPHFDDLFRAPLQTATFTRTMGRAVRDLLSKEGLAKQPERGSHALYRLAYEIGVDRKVGSFRPYTANLTAEPTPLDQAILKLYRYAGRRTRFITFGTESPYPLVEKDLAAAAAKLPDDVSGILGQLVLNLLDAHYWATLAFRKVPLEERVVVSRRLNLGEESVDALEYCPECDDVAKAWDEASLWYAGLKSVEALDTARRALAGKTGTFEWRTPLGWIRVYGDGNDRIDGDDALLLVDCGGNDQYEGRVGASTATRPISLALDLGGDDTYRGTVGAGLCGVGVLLDVAGKDAYDSEQQTQGFGQFGFGVLIDLAGDDTYTARYSSQGCGYFGIGLLFDANGGDTYYLHADGQGFAGPAGVGVLADRHGDDTYFADPDPKKSGRPSYHSKGNISVSNAQGCAMGRRGDGADGHSWAGGLGALIDAEGNDTYTSGNWSMGTGYWFGTGVLWDGGGNDKYDGHVWSQATGAHFCIGVLIDEGGDDTHVSRQNNSICFAHDFTIALLINEGGNDTYTTPASGLGFSINRSVAVFLDTGGNDRYTAQKGTVPGFARYDKRFADKEALSTYWVDTSSIGLFLDIGGTDVYWDTDRNNSAWGDKPDSDNRRVRNVGVGRDVERGEIRLR